MDGLSPLFGMDYTPTNSPFDIHRKGLFLLRLKRRAAARTTWPFPCEYHKMGHHLRTMHQVASCARMVVQEAMFTA